LRLIVQGKLSLLDATDPLRFRHVEDLAPKLMNRYLNTGRLQSRYR
jgi:hypothetical protein